ARGRVLAHARERVRGDGARALAAPVDRERQEVALRLAVLRVDVREPEQPLAARRLPTAAVLEADGRGALLLRGEPALRREIAGQRVPFELRHELARHLGALRALL